MLRWRLHNRNVLLLAKAAADAAVVATWASLLEEETEAGLVREPEVKYDYCGYYFKVMEDNYDYDH